MLDPNGNAGFGVAKPGFFGSDGRYSFENEPQFLKVPHLRNLYQKVGMFGMDSTFDPSNPGGQFAILPAPYNDSSFLGDQVRGFGFLHDGSVDTVFRFHGAAVFVERQGGTGGLPNPGGFPVAAPTDDPATAQQKVLANVQMRRQMEAFMLAFDSNLAPIVGQQATLAAWSGADAQARVDLLEARAAAGECEVVVHGVVRGDPVGFLYQPASGLYCRIAPAAARSATPPCARWRARAR